MTQPLPEWPLELGWYPTIDARHDCERARAEAAMARLRVAVEALTTAYAALGSYNDEACERAQDAVHEALTLIGDLPPPPSGAL
jgi:hypothetical protein